MANTQRSSLNPTDQVRARGRCGLALRWLVVLSLLIGALFVVGDSDASALAQDCPEGQVLSPNGVTCELDVGQGETPDTGVECPEGQVLSSNGITCDLDVGQGGVPEICPDGQQLDAAGLLCEDIVVESSDGICPAGQRLDAAGLLCEDDPTVERAEEPCQEGFSLGADGESCIADGPACDDGEVPGSDGTCVKSFKCSPGLILASDLLRCISGPCPDGELLSTDGSRCVARGEECPDGSPRPIGGACLVVETIDGPDGPEVVVRCDAADVFCQAQVKECADRRAAGEVAEADAKCDDPRDSCVGDDDECTAANDRLVECALRDEGDASDDGAGDEGVRIGGRDDPCTDLCPALHRLDPSGECIEYLDPTHPCVSFGQIPAGVTTNDELNGYSFLAGLGQCVTRTEFLRRLGNFEAAAGAEADALALLRDTTSEYLTVEEQLAELEQRLIATRRAVRQYTDAAADADVEWNRTVKLLADTRKQLVREQSILRGEVVDVFVIGGNEAAIESAVLSATNVTEIGVAQSYGRALLDEQLTAIERIGALETDATELATRAEAALRDVELSLDAAIEASDGLEQLLIDARVLREDQQDRRDTEAELVSQLREDKATYAQELGIFEQASREIADILDESEFLVGEFRDCGGSFANPILPTRISSAFGPRLHPILGYVRPHNGVDISAKSGEPIYASAPGIVTIASTFGGYGETVVLAHGGEFYTLYAHMSAIAAEPGEEVDCGDVIGFVGSTGLSTGPHLHFEIWDETKTAINPAPYLPQPGGN